MSHAKLSPSSAHRWMKCPGSVALCELLPPTTNSAAEEGTAAHWVLESCIKDPGLDPNDLVGDVAPNGWDVDEDMVEHVAGVLEYLENEYGETSLSEQTVHTGIEDCYGTADVFVPLPGLEMLVVGDLKYGYNPVHAKGNPQAILYAIGAVKEIMPDAKKVRIEIYQPRVRDGVDFHEYTIEELNAFEAEYRTLADAARAEGAPLVPGTTQCRYCDAAGMCKARLAHVQRIAALEFATLDDEELAEVIPEADHLRRAADALEAEALKRMEQGRKVPGWKLVWGRTRRIFTDEERVWRRVRRMRLVGRLTDQKLKSPAQMEKALGKKSAEWHRISTLVGESQAKITMAPESDKREPIGGDFEVIE